MGGTLKIFDDIYLTDRGVLGAVLLHRPMKLLVGETGALFTNSLQLSGWYQRCRTGYRLAIVLASLADVAERLGQPCPVYFGKRLLVPAEQGMPDDFFLLLIQELDCVAHEYVNNENDALMLYICLTDFRDALKPLNLSAKLELAFDLFLHHETFTVPQLAWEMTLGDPELNRQLLALAKDRFCREALLLIDSCGP